MRKIFSQPTIQSQDLFKANLSSLLQTVTTKNRHIIAQITRPDVRPSLLVTTQLPKAVLRKLLIRHPLHVTILLVNSQTKRNLQQRPLSRNAVKCIRNWLLWKSQRSTSIAKKTRSALSNSTKWSSRLRCAKIGSWLVNASSKIHARSHMVLTSWWESSTYLPTIRLRLAYSFTQQATALTVTVANSCTRSMTYHVSRPQTN